jgi:hypothetical protein
MILTLPLWLPPSSSPRVRHSRLRDELYTGTSSFSGGVKTVLLDSAAGPTAGQLMHMRPERSFSYWRSRSLSPRCPFRRSFCQGISYGTVRCVETLLRPNHNVIF